MQSNAFQIQPVTRKNLTQPVEGETQQKQRKVPQHLAWDEEIKITANRQQLAVTWCFLFPATEDTTDVPREF